MSLVVGQSGLLFSNSVYSPFFLLFFLFSGKGDQ